MNERVWATVTLVAIIVAGALAGFGCQRQYELQKACIDNGGIWTNGSSGQCIPRAR